MTTGLVLGSGGVRGLAHVGVLEALTERNIEPDIITASSAGAIIGALYAAEYTIDDIKELIDDFKVYEFIDFTNIGSGILKGQKARLFLEEQLGDQTFEDLSVDLVVNALDLNNDTTRYIDSGDVVNALHASMAIPGVFKPVPYDENYLLDAGYVNPLPVEPLPDCDQIILVDVSRKGQPLDDDTRFHEVVKEFFYYVQRRLQRDQIDDLRERQPEADILTIKPDTESWTMLSFSDLDEVVKRGYQAANKSFP
jgi:NTE family protein